MASLTETAYYTRRAVNWLIIAIAGYIVLRLAWGLVSFAYLAIFPPKPPAPTNAFGKLPAIKFPIDLAAKSSLTYRLETISGTVPTASQSAAVYFMPKTPANLLALNKAQELAEYFNLDAVNPIQESKNIYRFNDLKSSLRKLRYDIISNNFILRYAFEQDLGLFTEKLLPTNAEALSEAKSLLQTYQIYKEELNQGKTTVSYLKLNNSQLVKTTSLSQADAVRVDFFRPTVGNTRLVTPNPDEAAISIIFSGSQNSSKKILQFAYVYWPIDFQTSATYALKTGAQAWQDLQSGQGYIARYPIKDNQAIIRDVYLAYYESFESQMYLQPVFVFEGDDGFLAYVQAVSTEWIE